MSNLAYCKLTLEFEFGAIADSTMSVAVGSAYTLNPGYDCRQQCELYIQLPSSIRLEVSGKNINTDTLVDDKQQIVKDKYVKLLDIKLDNISVPKHYLEKDITLRTHNDLIHSNYFGFNGVVEINFTKSNVFHQWCDFKKRLK